MEAVQIWVLRKLTMHITTIRTLKRHLARLIGRPYQPPAIITAACANPATQRIGFMSSEISVPDDFDTMGASEIAALFN